VSVECEPISMEIDRHFLEVTLNIIKQKSVHFS